MMRKPINFGVPMSNQSRGGILTGLGPVLSWCWGTDIDCSRQHQLETCVDLSYAKHRISHALRDEITTWATLNLQHEHRYEMCLITCHYPRNERFDTTAWRWHFADLDDAFAFRLRWA